MKKKLGAVWLVAVCLLLGACQTKPAPVKESAAAFADNLIYQKQQATVTKEFTNGKQLVKNLALNVAAVKESFAAGLTAADLMTDEQAAAFTDQLFDQMQQKTSYTVKKEQENDQQTTVVYTVNGLDLSRLIQQSTDTLVERAIADSSLAKDDSKLKNEMGAILLSKVDQITVKKTAQTIRLTLTADSSTWAIKEDQKTTLTNLYLCFLTGAKDQAALSRELAAAVDQLTKTTDAKLK